MRPLSVPGASTVPATVDPLPSGDEFRGLLPALLCLSLAAFASGASLRLNDALLPRLAGEFSIELGTAAQVTGVFAVAYGVAQLLLGPIGERLGKVRLIAWACIASALASILCAVAAGFPWLVSARALAGAATACVIPLSMAWIGDVYPYEGRQHVLARFLTGQIFGLAAGVWLGGLAADHFSWRLPYWVLAGLYLVVGIALHGIHGRMPPRARTRRPSNQSLAGSVWADTLHVLHEPWARVILVCVFLEGTLLYGPFAFIATHLHRQFALSLSAAGSVVMLFGFGGLLFAMASRHLVSRLRESSLAGCGGAVMSASLLLVALAPAWPWAAAGVCGAGIGFYMLHSTLQVNATQMAPARRGAAVSMFASCFFLGQSAGVALASVGVDGLGTTAVIVSGAAGLIGVATVFARLRGRSR